MAAKSRGLDVDMAENRDAANNEPPPSTLAAALVDDLSTREQQPLKQNGPEDYKRLLAEVHSFSKIPDGEVDSKTKIDQNHKTIFLFVRLVLEPLTNDDPSAATPQSLSTACQALQVLKKTVEETPGVLMHTADAGSSNYTGGEILWEWLLPRLLTLIGRDHGISPSNSDRGLPEEQENTGYGPLQIEIASFLNLTFRIASGLVTGEGDLGMTLFAYLKDCINDVTSRISDPGLIANGPLLNPPLVLPTEQPLDPLKLPEEVPMPGLTRSTYTLQDAQVAHAHSTSLVLILANVLSELNMPYEAGLDYTAWILDTFSSLHDVQRKWCFKDLSKTSKSNVCLLFLRAMQTLKLPSLFLPAAISCKFYMVAANLCACSLEDPATLPDDFVAETLCPSLLELSSACRKFEPVSEVVRSGLLPIACGLMTSENSHLSKHKDFKLCIQSLIKQSAFPVVSSFEAYEGTFDHAQLNNQFHFLDLEDGQSNGSDPGRPSKRQKITEDSVSKLNNETIDEITAGICQLFGSGEVEDLVGLEKVAVDTFKNLASPDQCRLLELLGWISCSSAGTLKLVRGKDGSIQDAECSICDSRKMTEHELGSNGSTLCQSAVEIMIQLSQSPSLGELKRQRILAMLTLRRLGTHFRKSTFLDLESSHLGQWCVQCIQSSVRELRIAAGRTLPVFLRDPIESEVFQKNRNHIIEVLRTLSRDNPINLQETCILAWGQVGRVSINEDLNLVLLGLVEYLGHVNPIVSGVAFNEITAISATKGISPWQLFSPYWRSIAVTAVKDLFTRPQTAQLMADLLSISVPDLLRNTQSYTLPWLVLSKKKDIIQRITQVAGASDSWEICLNTKNLAQILAYLLVQPVSDQDEFIMALLKDVSPAGFEKSDLSDLIKIAPIEIAVELLNATGEPDEAKKSRTRHALQFLASRFVGAASTKSAKHDRKGSHVGPFLEQHVLGIMTQFSDIINDVQTWHPAAEKRRCLRGIEELLRVGKSYIASALPQICALLQSALTQKDLRITAFSTWATMAKFQEPEDLRTVLESTFAIIIQYWQDFENPSQQCAHELIGFLLQDREELIRECIDVLPSLASIPSMETYETELEKLKVDCDLRHRVQVLTGRIGHENASVVSQALLELSQFLRDYQSFLQASALSEQPDAIIGELLRSILDSCIKFSEDHPDIARLAAECMGLVGCLDPNRVETVRDRREIVVVSNFEQLEDTTDFVLFALQEILVKAFLSATSSRAQNLLSYSMQDLLAKCDFSGACAKHQKPGDHSETEVAYQKWLGLPEPVRATLTPFLRSKYKIGEMRKIECEYPIFQPSKKYSVWLRFFVLDLLQKAQNKNAGLIFDSFSRIIRIQDISPATFLLPYVVLHVVVAGNDKQREEVFQELYRILQHDPVSDTHHEKENLQLCSEAVFRVLDYLSRWVQEKNGAINQLRLSGGHTPSISSAEQGIARVEKLLSDIPAEVISRRAVQCKSYSRALFHWEAHIRQVRGKLAVPAAKIGADVTPMLERLQQIYTQIDEPDGIEGIAAHLHVLDIDQQILGHRKAGRWTAAQKWYEIKLNEDPANVDLQLDLLTCLKESGQHDVLLQYVGGLQENTIAAPKLLPYAAEASWFTGKWDMLNRYLGMLPLDVAGDFNMAVGHLLGAIQRHDMETFTSMVAALRQSIAQRLSGPTTDSLHACHESMLRLHVLTDLEMIAGPDEQGERTEILESLSRRLEVIGAHPNDKQYLLGIRRAAMELVSPRFTNLDVASAWLTTARLARKGNSTNESYNAVLHALQLGDESATIEQARLLWKGGHSRQAIQILQGAIATNKFVYHDHGAAERSFTSIRDGPIEQQNLLIARAHLLLAKWLDSAGQTQTLALRAQYQMAAKTLGTWEKGHYYLGRHYNKMLESQKNLAQDRCDEAYLTGQTARLVIDNYFRALTHGTKYIYQTLPRILTLWLDLGTQILQPFDKKQGYYSPEFITKTNNQRQEQLKQVHIRIKKSIQRLPSFVFYTALPQIVARIAHPNLDVVKYLQQIIITVVGSHPQQALWCLLAVSTSTQPDRKSRGLNCLQSIRNTVTKKGPGQMSLNDIVVRGERLTEQLLGVCNAGEFPQNRSVTCSLTKDLKFAPKPCIPSPLAVPIESTLTAALPTLTDSLKSHRAFSRDVITIVSFSDVVLVLSSLARPRKLTARASDGRSYGLLCKPKDDLRKDQRLMEFNSMINRSLKRDVESSKRQLYIKTYAVTPLNEECGIIEWIDGLKTFRDILMALYKTKGIYPNYNDIKIDLDEAANDESKIHLFTDRVLGNFPPIFHLWFVQMFPEPSAWFGARLKYTRSAAVMSMVGTILGLGDRHTENILFEEGNGGTFHVDFNCLFDKGLTFHQPELVPFRLTHNMVDAMGIYGYEGPFRKSSELTLKLLRQHEETLMTILEAFIHDPTLDLVKQRPKKKRDEVAQQVPDTPHAVLESIKRKIGGLLAGESVPLGVEGQVSSYIQQAVSPKNLAAMYIGWCAFF